MLPLWRFRYLICSRFAFIFILVFEFGLFSAVIIPKLISSWIDLTNFKD